MISTGMPTGLLGVQQELGRIEQTALRVAGDEPQAVDFGHSLQQVLRAVDAKDQAAAAQVSAVERGESDDLVGAMLSSQEASLSFSMLMQVRNKVVGAVDELIKLQL